MSLPSDLNKASVERREDLVPPIPVVGIVATNSLGFVDAVFHVYAEGEIAVPLKSPGVPRSTDELDFTRIVEPDTATGWYRGTFRPPIPDRIAQISFTSGTEGKPKGILLSGAALNDVVDRLNEVMGVDETIREYVGVPVTHSFGFGRVRACATAGGQAFIPESGFNPLEIAEMLDSGEINAISAVPTLWRVLLSHADLIGENGSRVRWIEIGSQYMSAGEKRRLRELFPSARIIQHYGLTEASRTTFLDISRCDDDALESVGKPHGATEVQISPEGRIRIRGPHVSSGQITPTGIESIVDPAGWLTTNDLGRIENGYLYYEGRADDLINCGGVKVQPERLERALESRFGKSNVFAVARVDDPVRGDGIVVAIDHDAAVPSQEVRHAAAAALSELAVKIGDALHVIELDSLPRTETGKLKRKDVAAAFVVHQRSTAQLSREGVSAPLPGRSPAEPLTHDQETMLRLWREVLGDEIDSIDVNFFELGGDSLSSIQLMLKVSQAGFPRETARQILAGRTIREVTGGTDTSPQSTGSVGSERRVAHAINSARGLLVLLIVAVHWLPGLLERITDSAPTILASLVPLFRLGTPGFAMVFGLGLGFFVFPQAKRRPEILKRNMKFGAMLVGGGICLLAAVKFATVVAAAEGFGLNLYAKLFYSVLAYYLLAIISLPLWIYLNNKLGGGVGGALLLASSCFLLDLVVSRSVTPEVVEGPLEVARLLLHARYNYFFMTGCVMIGVAIAKILRAAIESPLPSISVETMLAGSSLLAFGIVLSFDGGYTANWFGGDGGTLFRVISYAGAVLTVVGFFLHLSFSDRTSVRSVSNVLAIVGILSLPIYIGHELVIPAKRLMAASGMHGGVSLALSTTVFSLALIYCVGRLLRVYSPDPTT